jgi:1-acyl-sn-glycerol-3-phosphate acyltransferase
MITTDRRFWPLFWTQFLGAANDNFFKNAMVILITYNSVELFGLGSASLVAAAGGIFILPYVLFSAIAGQLSDHYDKADVMKMTKITELIVMIMAAIGFFTANYTLLFVVLFLMGAQSAFFSPVKFGSLPEILKPSELTLGNAYIGGGTFVAILLGTIVGGVSASLENAIGVTSAGIVLVSVIGIWTSRNQQSLNDSHGDVKIDYTFFKPTYEILSTTWKEKNVMKAITGITWFWFFGAAILSILPALVKELFLGTEIVGTIFLATFTIGMGVGAYLCNRLSNKRVEVGMVPLATVMMSFGLLLMALVAGIYKAPQSELMAPALFFQQAEAVIALIGLFMITTFGGMFIIPQQAFMQKSARADYLARTIAANSIWNAIGMVLAAVLLMLLHAAHVSLPKILAIMAILNFSYAVVAYYFYREEMWRFVMQLACWIGYNIDVDGAENIPETGPVILASNHVSFVDWLFIMSVSPRPIRWVIDHFYYNRPGLKQFLDQGKLIPIATRRENSSLLENAFVRMQEALDDDRCLGIFPEGTLTRKGSMGRFQPGIKKIVDQTGAQVVPIVINGAWGSFFSHDGLGPLKGFSLFQKRKISLTILPPIEAENFCYKDLEGLMAKSYLCPLGESGDFDEQ